MYPELSGQTAIVTGAASGIGRASAKRFGKEGANVVIVDMASESGQEVADSIESAIFVNSDVSKPKELDRVVTRTTEKFDPPTILHNNAGIRGHSVVHKTETEDWKQTLDVNLNSVFELSKKVIPSMLENDGGAIVNTSALAGIRGSAGKAPYSTSKGGINTLTKEMARDYADDGIRVNAVLPGHVRTKMSFKTDSEGRDREAIISNVPMGRDAAPEEIASVVAFLASEEASYMTGALVPIDGGLSW